MGHQDTLKIVEYKQGFLIAQLYSKFITKFFILPKLLDRKE